MQQIRHDKTKSQRVRVLLDTNVWRYVVDEDAGPDLLRAASLGAVQVLIAPSVLYEALRTSQPELRRRLVSLMTLSAWGRLMPEAYSESQELLSEIRRVRPGWLRTVRNRRKFVKILNDWQRRNGGFWDRARLTPDLEAQYLVQLGDASALERARMEAHERRQEFRDNSWSDSIPLDSIRGKFPGAIAGWNGDDIEPWRVDGWSAMGNALSDPKHPYSDWLSSDVNIDRMTSDRSSWGQFWFYDVKSSEMPRCWLRWAFVHLQRFRSVTDGTPCDVQLATYLPESDLVISADKTFVRILEQCRTFAPCPVPASARIPSGRQGVDALLRRVSGS